MDSEAKILHIWWPLSLESVGKNSTKLSLRPQRAPLSRTKEDFMFNSCMNVDQAPCINPVGKPRYFAKL